MYYIGDNFCLFACLFGLRKVDSISNNAKEFFPRTTTHQK